jgi:hypothetical protein
MKGKRGRVGVGSKVYWRERDNEHVWGKRDDGNKRERSTCEKLRKEKGDNNKAKGDGCMGQQGRKRKRISALCTGSYAEGRERGNDDADERPFTRSTTPA